MLITTLAQIKQYVPTVMMKTSSIDAFQDAVCQAQFKLQRKILSRTLTEQLETLADADATLLGYARRVIALDAFISAVPKLDLSLSDSGFVVTSNEAVSPASRQRVDAMMEGLQKDLQLALDMLVTYLKETSTYSSWKGTKQFDIISQGLFCTLEEFLNVCTEDDSGQFRVPKTWWQLHRMAPKLNAILMVDVAYYITKEYAEELLEKYRDDDTDSTEEATVLYLVQQAVANIAIGASQIGENYCAEARELMKKYPAKFPTFTTNVGADWTDTRTNGPVVNFL